MAPADDTLGKVRELARSISGDINSDEIDPIAGDAGARRYFRAVMKGKGRVVLQLSQTAGEADKFVEMTGVMKNLGVDTPMIYATRGRLIVMEDLGDSLLQNRIKGMDATAITDEYKENINSLQKFQLASMNMKGDRPACFRLAFDVEKLMWEVEFADRYFIGAYKGTPLKTDARAALRHEWGWITNELARQTPTLAHRDLHCRNIIVKDGRRVWIDYQDARMGVLQYDLASLLYDPYADLPEGAHSVLADYYLERWNNISGAKEDHEQFRRLLTLTGVQRLYKALGTYGYQAVERGADIYVQYIPRAVNRLAYLLKSLPELAALDRLLAPLLGKTTS